MWFKTRVGLASVTEPSEILIGRFDLSAGERWCVYAHSKVQSDGDVSGLLGKARFRNPSTYLAFFLGGEDVQHQIGECLAQIERAVRVGEAVCDLSSIGSAEAWKNTWHQVTWPEVP